MQPVNISIRSGWPFQEEITVTVLPASPSRIRAETENFYLEEGRPAQVKFIVDDTYGNAIRAGEKPDQHQPENFLGVSLPLRSGDATATIELTAGPGKFYRRLMPKNRRLYVEVSP